MKSIKSCKAPRRELRFKKLINSTKVMTHQELQSEVDKSDVVGKEKFIKTCRSLYLMHPENKSKTRKEKERRRALLGR